MASIKSRKNATGLIGVETEALPIAVLVVTIDKKRLTSALYKQLTEEDVIDEETGELRGIPIGYFNLHPKEGCPHEKCDAIPSFV